jgi:adenosylmethionine-8-amino-7-oxononanoate aminotransferase
VFFTSGGGEAVESAWKLVKQYFKLIGKPTKYKVISRYLAYHGTTAGALSITGVPGIKQWFEPLVPGAVKAANTNIYRASDDLRNDPHAFARHCAQSIEDAILQEGPETVAAVFVEPVQNVGGCFPPPPGYLQMVREICDKYDVLMIADETITGFGRIGAMFAVNAFGVVPDMITTAKGLSSGYVPIGAVIASEKLFEPFAKDNNLFSHGFTYSGHAVGAAVACANLDILEREQLPQRVAELAPVLRAKMETLLDIPIVGDVRGAGFFYAVEIVSDKVTRETFNDEDSERILRNFLSNRVWELGLYCRADDRGDPVLQVSPPLTMSEEQMDNMVAILRQALTEASEML